MKIKHSSRPSQDKHHQPETGLTIPASTPQIRRFLKSKRRNLSEQDKRSAAKAIRRNLMLDLRLRSARRIGSYWPVGGEIDLRHLHLRRRQKVYYPILREDARPWQGKGLLFGEAIEPLRLNRFGIPEPQTLPFLMAQELDYLLIPLIGFDRQGNRIGMGGGYYDRALAVQKRFPSAFLMGVAYDWQEIDMIDAQDWDIPLDGVTTDKERILFSR